MLILEDDSIGGRLFASSLFGLAVSLAAGCSTEAAPSPHNLELRTAPLNLEGIDFACYDILVENGDGAPVVALGDPTTDLLSTEPDTKTICSTQYGNGDGGAITYIAPCDASEPAHTVTLWVDGLYSGTPANPTAVPFQDPCPNGCILPATCAPNADTPVEFNLTMMRPANQGFFDVAVNFDDIFCSAKLDCADDRGADLELLHNGGERDLTAVIAFACTGGQTDDSTCLYVEDVVITCDDPCFRAVVDPASGPGNVTPVANEGGLLFGAATYRGEEGIANKLYWNVALGLDETVFAQAGNCRVSVTATASSGLFTEGTTPQATSYPVVEWSAPLITDGARACGRHQINGDDGVVSTRYTSSSNPEVFTKAMCKDAPTAIVDPVEAFCAGKPTTVASPSVLEILNGVPSVRVNGGVVDVDHLCLEEIDRLSIMTTAGSAKTHLPRLKVVRDFMTVMTGVAVISNDVDLPALERINTSGSTQLGVLINGGMYPATVSATFPALTSVPWLSINGFGTIDGTGAAVADPSRASVWAPLVRSLDHWDCNGSGCVYALPALESVDYAGFNASVVSACAPDLQSANTLIFGQLPVPAGLTDMAMTFPNLETAGLLGLYHVSFDDPDPFPVLATVTDLHAEKNSVLSALNLPSLTTLSTATLRDNATLQNINAPLLTAITGNVLLATNNAMLPGCLLDDLADQVAFDFVNGTYVNSGNAACPP